MTTMFSSYSSAIMLRPISPKPPRGMARNLGCLAKKGELLLRLGDGGSERGGNLAPLLHPVEVGLDGLEVLLQRAHQEAVVEGRGRVVDGNVAHAVFDDHFAMQARDRLVPGQQARQRVPAKHQDDFGPDQPKLLLEIGRAGLRFGGLRIPICRRPAFEDVGDKDVAAREPDATGWSVEHCARRTNNRLALQVLVLTGRLPDDHDPRVLRANARDSVGSSEAEGTTPAIVNVPAQAPQVGERQQVAGQYNALGLWRIKPSDPMEKARGPELRSPETCPIESMATLLAGLMELDVATTEPGGGRHHGVVQLELKLVGTAPWLGVVGDVCLVRLGGSAHVGRAQDLAAIRSEVGGEGVARDPRPPDSQPPANVHFHPGAPEAGLHT